MGPFGRSRRGLGNFLFTSTTACVLACWLLPFASWGGGVVSSCDEASLRAAMNGGGLVTFACDGTITLSNTLVMVTDTVLDGTGHDVTLDGNSQIRILTVPTNLVCTISGLRIANGGTTNEGAGILNSGTLTLQGCTFSNNVAFATLGTTRGGAVLNGGTLNIMECTFVANQARGSGGGVGGAIRNGGTLRVNGCTFVQNTSTGSGGAIGILASPAVGAGITNCTFYGNTAYYGGAALYTEYVGSPAQYFNVVNCTLASNSGSAIQGMFGAPWVANCIVAGSIQAATDGGNNILGTTIDPRLGPLTNNGGPTLTLEPLADSPAIDQGNDLVCPSTDQRGVSRPVGARCDIGAVETSVTPVPPVLQFASSAASVNEGTSNATLNVVRLGNSGPTVSVHYATADGTAAAGQDYVQTSGTLTFGFGQTNATLAVPVLNDVTPEPAETVQLTLSAPSAGASLGDPATMTLTIEDNDPAQPGSLRLSHGSFSAGEGGLDAVITVLREGGTNGTVTVDFATSDGTAFAGQDYAATNGTLVFGDTEVSKSFVVSIVTDAISEAPETFNLALSSPGGGATLGIPSLATVTVWDGLQTVTSCDETSLRAAVTAGGRVTLACEGTIFLTSPLEVANAVFIEGAGYDVTISGSNAVRLFNLNPGAQLRLLGLTLADGSAKGPDGHTGQPGGPGEGGAIYNNGGVLVAEDCLFTRNRAQGGTGGPPTTSTSPGGMARGGVVYMAGAGAIIATNCAFVLNSALGGAAGRAGTISMSAAGGNAAGGAIFNADGTLHLSHSSVVSNSVLSGQGQRYGGLGTNDAAQGGAICSQSGGITLIQVELAQNSSKAAFRSGANGGALSQLGGTLTLVGSYLHGNRVEGGVQGDVGGMYWVGGPAFGGSLYVATGTAGLGDSTLANNLALGGFGTGGDGGPAFGGGLYQAGGSAVQMTNCTLSGNQAQGGPASRRGNGYGGALCVSEADFVAVHATIAGNSAQSSASLYGSGVSLGGGIYSTNGSVTLRNSILANNLSGSNWFGTTLVDDGNNLSSDASCPFTAPGSLSNTDPLLAPLDDFGGPTPTMALLAGSPALDAAHPAWCPPTDQRSVARPYGPACDIGAFESAPPYSIRGGIAGYLASPRGCAVVCSTMTSPVDPATGRYVLWDIAAGSHLVTPQASHAVFEPNNQTVNVSADVVGVNFHAWRSNALSIEPVSGPVFRNVFAGAAGDAWDLMRSTNVWQWQFDSTHTVGPNGLFEFRRTNAPATPPTFFKTEKP